MWLNQMSVYREEGIGRLWFECEGLVEVEVRVWFQGYGFVLGSGFGFMV